MVTNDFIIDIANRDGWPAQRHGQKNGKNTDLAPEVSGLQTPVNRFLSYSH